MVGYDSIIPPGRVGYVTPQVNIQKVTGKFKKSVTVESNAENEPKLRISLGGEVLPTVGLSTRYVRMVCSPADSLIKTDLVVTSDKKDLKVTEIAFEEPKKGEPAWQNSLPIYVEYDFSPRDTSRSDGYHEYALTMWTKYSGSDAKRGTFEIKTNHPKKKKMDVRGIIACSK